MRIAKICIRAVLIVLIVLFALFNYKVITFSHGISKRQEDNKNVLQSLQSLSDVKVVKYYDKIVPTKSETDSSVYIYRLYVETTEEAYLLNVTQDHIDAFEVVSKFDPKYTPQKITPIPFYVEIIVGIIVLFPFELFFKFKKSKNTNNAKKNNKSK